ncbi:MAG: Chromosomal replication initiator protein DnaA [Nitrosomonadaceae bacterium]|nr:Chromosomal replication initiator protein DnaA [Nitrosomonadaceae bacterium]
METSSAPNYKMKTNHNSHKKHTLILERNKEFESVIRAVCRAFHITEVEFFSRRRLEPMASARFCYWHILQKVHNMGLSQIGRLTGYTHGSIFHGIKCVRNDLKTGDRAFKARFSLIVDEIGLKQYYELHKGMAESV